MKNDFVVLVDKRDSEKLRKFLTGNFSSSIKKILIQKKSNFVWGFHSSNIQPKTWSKIKKNDEVFFTIPKNKFEFKVKINSKIINKDWGQKFWPEQLISKEITHFLFFERLEKIHVPFSELTSSIASSSSLQLPGLYMITNKSKTKKKSLSNPIKKFLVPKKGETIPQKSKSEVFRFIRDPVSVRKLKKLYDNKCQICGYTIKYSQNKFYSEVHHYNPLEENGNDDVDNMVVVCPNHHTEFDYKLIAIDLDGKTIIDRKGVKISEIKFHPDHKISERNIKSQLRYDSSEI